MADNAEIRTKTDAEAGDMSALANRLAAKADKIKYAVIVMAIVLVAGIAIFSYQRRASATREAEAENKMFQTMIDLGGNPEKDAVAVFDDLAKEFSGLPAGARARINQFSVAFVTGEYAKAETAINDFLRVYPKHPMIPRARLAQGQTLVMLDRVPEAITIFRDLAYGSNVEIQPEAKLALAQSLEHEAEAVRDNPEEYRSRLEAAAAEYNDIVVRSRVTSSQRGFWPQTIVIPADFALVAIKDRLEGYEHPSPVAMRPARRPGADGEGFIMVDAEPIPRAPENADEPAGEPVMATPPPADNETPEETPAETADEQPAAAPEAAAEPAASAAPEADGEDAEPPLAEPEASEPEFPASAADE